MKLRHVRIIKADSCGDLLNGFSVEFRGMLDDTAVFEPLCLIGPNGTGKSQFLQVVAEMFQLVLHECVKSQERRSGNEALEFVAEYYVRPTMDETPVLVRISRQLEGKRRQIRVERDADGEWVECDLAAEDTIKLLPTRIIGYTSGDNETFSLPFFVSRAGYASEVGTSALHNPNTTIPDTRLMLIDYHTHLEVFVANLLLGNEAQRKALLEIARLDDLHSFRCIVQLAHPAAPKIASKHNLRKGIQLTKELKGYIDQLQRCATCWLHEEKEDRYTFDFWINDATREAFRAFWDSPLDLFNAFHKLSMLNDLVIPKPARQRFNKDIENKKFAARLPSPQDEDKVFRFQEVCFKSENKEVVDYVSLSDGEHQFAQLLGMMCMASMPNVLFLLDEPESHFNPQWRTRFISKILDLPTSDGKRHEKGSPSREQELLLTTHAPFVPSDMHRERVFIFKKSGDNVGSRITAKNPDVETYGTTFDSIIENCFEIRPPMSDLPRIEIEKLMESGTREKIADALQRLGDSVDKIYLMDKLRELRRTEKA